MDHFIDIQALRMLEIPPAYILAQAFTKVHRGLSLLNCSDIGISFPDVNEAKTSLGLTLRLHGTHDHLLLLLSKAQTSPDTNLATLNDYITVRPIKPIPFTSFHRHVRRVRHYRTEDKRHRLITKYNYDPEEVIRRVPFKESLTLPFLQISSKSNNQQFRLFIKHDPIQNIPKPGKFNSYGLGRDPETTIPWF